MQVSEIITIVMGILAAFFGGVWAVVRSKLSQVAGLLVYVNNAIMDNKISPEEEKEIVRRVRELLGHKFTETYKSVEP
jgi:hypothetical protein